MDISELRPEFSLAILSKDEKIRSSLIKLVEAAGYQFKSYSSFQVLFEDISNEAPHFLVVSTDSMDSAKDFFEKIRSVCSEVLILVIGTAEQFSEFKRYSLFGLYDYIVFRIGFEDHVIWALDKAAERLYLQYQNEQLLEDLDTSKGFSESVSESHSIVDSSTLTNQELSQFVDSLDLAPTSDKAIEEFFKYLHERTDGHWKGIFFKFYPALYTLVATQTLGIHSKTVQGLGIKLEGQDAINHKDVLMTLEGYERFKVLMNFALKVKQFRTRPLLVRKEVRGLFTFWRDDGQDALMTEMELEFCIFRLVYEMKLATERLSELEVYDEVTGFYNAKAFKNYLQNEFSRARRLELPVSLIHMAVDGFADFRDKFGIENANILLKSIAIIIKQTSRMSDITSRIGEAGIVIIVPHVDRRGASIRAERLRKMIETAEFKLLKKDPQTKITLSLGISEYPGLCKDAGDLVKSAETTMRQLQAMGGNKVGLASVAKGFVPDFLIKGTER